MGKPSVVSTAVTMCSFGAAPCTLNVIPSTVTIGGKPAGTIMDNTPANLPTFGMCMSLSNPAVAAATAAALGVLTPMPCMPVIAAPWVPPAAQAYGVQVPAPSDDDEAVTQYLMALTATDGAVGPGSALMSVTYAAMRSTADEFGYDRQSIAADITAGSPPRLLSAATGEFDSDRIVSATLAGPVGPDATQKSVDGAPLLRWREDFQIELQQVTALSPIGSAGRLAVPDDATLLYATFDDGIESLIDAADGSNGTLADDADLAELAAALDEHNALSAMLMRRPSTSTLGDYKSVAVGFSWDGSPHVIMVYAASSPSDAKALAAQVEDVAVSGVSETTRQPWSDLLPNPQVRDDGNLVIATFDSSNASLWASIAQRQENLL